MSQELTERLLALSESYSNLFLQVGRKCEGLCTFSKSKKLNMSLMWKGVEYRKKYTYAAAGDKQCIRRYKHCFDCSQQHLLKRKLADIEFE